MKPSENHHHRFQQAKSITLLGAVGNALLGVLKVFGGIFSHSHALVADGLHSFSDLFTDAMVLVASKYGSQDADDAHPYGHQRIETAATLLLALLLILTGIGIAWDSVEHLLNRNVPTPKAWALPIALLSLLTNEGLFYLTHQIGKKIDSNLILANAWHHRSDSAASLIVLIGTIGSLLGWHYLDPIAAVLVGCSIIHMGIQYGWDSVKELVDTGVDPQQVRQIARLIKHIDGVEKVHQLRNRKMGSDLYIDVHILVNPWISVSEGHQIAQRVHYNLMSKLKNIKDVIVHVDPEDDELNAPSKNLPSRHQLEKAFLNTWIETFPAIQGYTLHYLDGNIHIDIQLSALFKQWSSLRKHTLSVLDQYPYIKNIRYLTIVTKK